MTKLATLCLCLAGLAAAQAPRNLIDNSSFEVLNEDGVPVGWQAAQNESAIAVDAAAAADGRNSIRFTLDGQETCFTHREYLTLEPGKTYTFSAAVRTKGLTPPANLQILVINLGWSFGYQSRLPLPPADAEWSRYSRSFVVPPANANPYQGKDNVEYTVVVYAKDARGEVWIDSVQLEEGAAATDYAPREGRSAAAADPVYAAVLAEMSRSGFRSNKYVRIEQPLFAELLGEERGPDRVLYYGYHDLNVDEEQRPAAKKFGYRYVLADQVQELRSHPFVPMTNAWKRGGVGSYATLRMILRPDVSDVAPKVFDDQVWIMDPRWQDAYLKAAVKLAEQSLDQAPDNLWGNTWGLWAGDEVFESAGIRVVPKEQRDAAFKALDQEIRERFGFGKFGMPEAESDANPFARIAHRRWVNARLTETYRQTYAAVKKVNPKLVMVGPDPCGGVPPVDLEAMTPWFDLVSNQSWYSPTPFTQQLATGADTKAMVDLSACPVWGLVQHTAAADPEALREQYSQVYRNGGQGLVVLGVEWYDRELEHPKFIDPAKWRALLEITDTVTTMNRVRLPEADTALLYASTTYLTFDSPKMANPEHPQVYAAYAALGPGAGSWFHFVSDRQIERGTRDLSAYKVLYIPLATYQSAAVLGRVEAYVRAGGIVVCTDPTAFTWDLSGESLAPAWESCTGVRRGEPVPVPGPATVAATLLPAGSPAIVLTFARPGTRLQPLDASAIPFATYADGTPAATLRELGKGKIIVFGADPCASPDRNTPMTQLVRSLQRAAGARLDQPIWRFKLPPFKTVAVADPERGRCLTGNHVVLAGKEVKPGRSLASGGTYTYDRFPTGMADAQASGDIPFDQGHLTNRAQAYRSRDLSGGRSPWSLEKWMVSYTDRAPVTLTLDLQKAYALERLTLFCSGRVPEIRAEGSSDRQTWSTLATSPAPPTPSADVLDLTMPLAGTCRYVRLTFAERPDEVPMELAELELWGTETP